MPPRVVLAALLLVPSAATAGPEAETAPRNYGNLRIGGASTGVRGRAVICGEVAPHRRIAIEGCGNGGELVHNDAAPATSHYLLKVSLAELPVRGGWLVPVAGAGFAELQVKADDLGFNFRSAGKNGESTAGPEATAGVRGLFPLAHGFELVVDLRFSVAYMAYAPELDPGKARWQPTAALSVGAGF